jgi:carbon storage regulator
MLCVGRKARQSVKIGSDIVVMVISVKGGKVRLGVSAPDGVPIVRDDAKQTQLREKPHG